MYRLATQAEETKYQLVLYGCAASSFIEGSEQSNLLDNGMVPIHTIIVVAQTIIASVLPYRVRILGRDSELVYRVDL